ncbi:hypothetical protein QE152_g41497 [Popillia japonica]|uniref:Uncharacterized protein n=1 Tax=Popillia japonica TaxID=7064 RepID=A0AAW1G9T8_POPJA
MEDNFQTFQKGLQSEQSDDASVQDNFQTFQKGLQSEQSDDASVQSEQSDDASVQVSNTQILNTLSGVLKQNSELIQMMQQLQLNGR